MVPNGWSAVMDSKPTECFTGEINTANSDCCVGIPSHYSALVAKRDTPRLLKLPAVEASVLIIVAIWRAVPTGSTAPLTVIFTVLPRSSACLKEPTLKLPAPALFNGVTTLATDALGDEAAELEIFEVEVALVAGTCGTGTEAVDGFETEGADETVGAEIVFTFGKNGMAL